MMLQSRIGILLKLLLTFSLLGTSLASAGPSAVDVSSQQLQPPTMQFNEAAWGLSVGPFAGGGAFWDHPGTTDTLDLEFTVDGYAPATSSFGSAGVAIHATMRLPAARPVL